MITQFPRGAFRLRVFSFIQTPDELRPVFAQLEGAHPIIFHTTLFTGLKHEISRFARAHRYPVYDLTGEAMEFLRETSGLSWGANPDALHELNQEYEQRIKSLEYTIRHDDALGLRSLQEAQIILLGVSRTSKTPTSVYLAYKGFQVANVPLIKGIELPAELDKSLYPRMVGLTIEPDKLQEIRLRRAYQDRIPGSDYTNLASICDELRWAQRVFTRIQCPVIDVTNHAIEETAALVLKALKFR
jgi:regulator of PEP synthase PpsR (kinase-PPPase family)